VIDDEELVDALDDFRQAATPAVLERIMGMATAAKYYAERDSKMVGDVAGFEALYKLASVVAKGAGR
jgi:hypothetical protein